MTLECLVASAADELAKISRTVQLGKVDTSAAIDKHADLKQYMTTTSTLSLALERAARFLWEALDRPIDLDELLRVNEILVEPFYETAHWRDHEVAYYLESVRVRDHARHLVTRLLDIRTASEEMADIHYSINLYGHYFRDGCSRTAVLVGIGRCLRFHGSVLRLPPRSTYLACADDVDRLRVAIEEENGLRG